MGSVNKAIIVGHLGQDPEIRTTGSGTVVATLSIATNERIKRQGEWTDHTEWHRVTAFGKTAENVERYCRKGRQVYVEGRIRTEKWQDRDGNDRWSTKVYADTVTFLGGRDDGGRRDDRQQGGGPSGQGGSGKYDEDDIPF